MKNRVEQLFEAQGNVLTLYRAGDIEAAHVEWSDKIATAFNSPDPRARRLARQFSLNIKRMIDDDLSADTGSVT